MGCFLACFGGGDGDRRRRRRKSRRRSPSRYPPRPAQVALVGEASSLADVVVKKASAAADVAVNDASAAGDVVVKEEAPPPLPEERALTPPPPQGEVADELVSDTSPGSELREPSEQRALTPPSPTPTVKAAEQVVIGLSPDREPRELTEQKASHESSLLQEKKVTPPPSPMKRSAVAAAVVSTPAVELREVSEQESRSSGKKKVTFNMNVITYENTALPDQDEEPSEPVKSMEDEKHMRKTVMLPENHRYGNCTDSDGDDDADEYDEDDNYGDESDEEEDFVDCKIDLVDGEEMNTGENTEESHESLFSLPMSKDQQNDHEFSSPAPKSSGTSAQDESPLIQGNNHRDRSQYVRPVLNPIRNLSEWKEVKAQALPVKKLYKENLNSEPNVGASLCSKAMNQTKMGPSNSSKEVSVDASLSTWLVSSDNSTVDKAQSKSPRSISSVSREDRPVLGALTVDDLKRSSATSSPRRSPSHNREEVPILGTVGSYWSSTKQGSGYCSSRSDSGTNGIPNTTSKYREDKRVNWHSIPFNVRLEKALKKSST